MGGPSSVGTAKKQKPAGGGSGVAPKGPTADDLSLIDDLNEIRTPAGGAGGAAGKRRAGAPKKGPATEEELALLTDLKDVRALVKSNLVTLTAECATTIKAICINTY